MSYRQYREGALGTPRGAGSLRGDRTTEHQGKLFYGWIVVAVMATAGALSMAMGTLNFGLFIKPMGDDLGIGRSIFGWAQTMRQVASAATSPLVGGLIDRFGSRVLLAVSAAITGAALIGVGFSSQAWQIVALFAIMGVVGMSGPGALVTSVPVAKWFVQKRGKALSFMSLGIPIGGVVFVPLTQLFIDAFGWRHAWVVLAIIGAGIIIPLSLALVRRQPEDMGLLPDGAPPSSTASKATGSHAPRATPLAFADERSWTREEALRSSTFWRLVLVFGLVGLAMGTVGVHRIPAFMDRGLDPRLVSFATALDAAAAGVSTFTLGMLADRVPARFIGAVGYAILTLATALTVVADTTPLMFLAMITFGLGAGGLMLTQNYLWADYFGRQHLGSIRGVVMPITLVFGGTGAPLAGYVRDFTGSYSIIWVVGTVLMALGAMLLVLTPSPQKREGTVPVASPATRGMP